MSILLGTVLPILALFSTTMLELFANHGLSLNIEAVRGPLFMSGSSSDSESYSESVRAGGFRALIESSMGVPTSLISAVSFSDLL